jgi:hypothetical protein
MQAALALSSGIFMTNQRDVVFARLIVSGVIVSA